MATRRFAWSENLAEDQTFRVKVDLSEKVVSRTAAAPLISLAGRHSLNRLKPLKAKRSLGSGVHRYALARMDANFEFTSGRDAFQQGEPESMCALAQKLSEPKTGDVNNTPTNSVSYFARTNFHNRHRLFGIKQADRLSHIYIIGKTGVGKSTLLEMLARQDMSASRGFALVDPHGDLVERVVSSMPPDLENKVIYLNAPDHRQPYGYNPLRRVRDDKIPLAVSGMLETLKKLWPDAWGVRMEHVLRNTLYALLERGDATLPDVLRMYTDEKARKSIVRGIRNETVKRFWKNEFEHYPARLRAEACAPIQNKLGALLSNPTLYRILVEPKIDIRFRSLMDNGRTLLVNVSKGQLGEEGSLLLGSLVVSTLGLAALSRAEAPRQGRRPFFVYLDEFHNFTTLMLANMMSELRKYGVGLVLAHQHLHQLEPDIRHAVFGNAATLISFRVGAEDAPYLAAEFLPTFGVEDMLNLANRNIYLKLMIDGSPSRPFSAETM